MTNKLLTITVILLTTFSLNVQAQNDLTKQAESILKRARLIYDLEKAAWLGGDLFADNNKLNKHNVESYITYKEDDYVICAFYSTTDSIIAEYTFTNLDSNHVSSFIPRSINAKETELIKIKRSIYSKFGTKEFKKVKKDPNTNFNLVPVIIDNIPTCYLINAINNKNKLILGNDYIIQFDNNYNVIKVAGNHKGVQEIPFDADGEAFFHTHVICDTFFETEIATLMLYRPYIKIQEFIVISKTHTSTWNNDTFTLTIK